MFINMLLIIEILLEFCLLFVNTSVVLDLNGDWMLKEEKESKSLFSVKTLTKNTEC